MIHEIKKDSYPETLLNAYKPPKKLYVRGSLPDFSKTKLLCVVGSRTMSPYGRDVCIKLIEGLRGYPISIVSGLAIGIDSLSHKVALDVGLHCVAFPGSGLDWDKIYPSSRLSLAKDIVSKGGALISEYPPEFKSTFYSFPTRNKLMAGISHATMIIEARQHSGSLMTAEYALEFNRDVLTVPGSMFSDLSYGPHMLVKNGATPIQSSKEILEALGFDASLAHIANSPRFRSYDPVTQKILRALGNGEVSVDALIESMGIPAHELSTKLTSLELEGVVKISGSTLHLSE